ncbi:thermonuclease family protein [Mesorhizobium sp. B2-3-14]|uniref:thermonuclease family protein n=1 Tax=unclassified Mesorhizobium TaxID=325217 RepID=UPI0011295840|nr:MULTISPECIES: thermonuclease family protein [unclassified Mesorhizobium]MBZ9931728.1 thermonuclease family protein [Mesorhizobium sp. BR1-1-5]MBZ9905634.1 thermonuclease family protein [Mesorhizobium sp. BR115XR7A]TPJ13740.1 thermonuclease family protein [Mesorhizobium sp. B2-7-3]TPK73883.1 thermonuclease family protein [Mesorhizobium sp. B2-4-18]TPL74097.1 thermonuclease family protein [Mesorhizobium sp. B2-3-15]
MRTVRILLAGALAAGPAGAAPPGYFDLRPGVTLETGDSWVEAGTKYRLYGTQACLRGTFYTDAAGRRADCGEASLAVFGALIADTRPECAPVLRVGDTVHVACFVMIEGDRLDLGNLMITSGFAFAALRADGLPYHAGYAVAEQAARARHAGLWQFKDVQHPAILLGQAAGAKASRP